MSWGMGIVMILLAAILIGGTAVALWSRRKLRQISKAAFGTDSIAEGLRRQEERLATTPKSVSGMTGVYLPQIQRDFPEVSLEELVHKAENQLKEVLAAVELQDISRLREVSEDLESQVRLWIEDDKRSGVREHFQKVKIHRTEVSRYQKTEGCCTITLQSAVEYRYWKEPILGGRDSAGQAGKNNRVGNNATESRMTQTRYEMDWMYVQDASLAKAKGAASAVICPQCGAPITRLGSKYCEYCGSAVEPVNMRAWSLNRIAER